MGRDQWATAVDRFTAIRFKGVGGIIQTDAEKGFEEVVGDAIEQELEPRVIDYSAALDKAAAENTVPTLIQMMPVPDDITAVIGLVSHHDDRGFAFHVIESTNDGPAEASWTLILNGEKLGQAFLEINQQLPSAVAASVINHEYFMSDILQLQFQVEMFDRGNDACLLVLGGNHH